MPQFLLEVIACSLEDARAAEAGGANRLELCSRLDLQGLTPSLETVAAAAGAVSIPIRVMVRSNEGFQASERQLDEMVEQVAAMAPLRIEGLIAGFHDASGRLDFAALDRLLRAAPAHWKLTHHRAFDFALGTPEEKLREVLRWGRADLILSGSPLPLAAAELSRGKTAGACAPEGFSRRQPPLEFLLGGGVTAENALGLLAAHGCRQVHIGRAARLPAETTAPVSERRVRAFRDLLDRG